MTVGGLPTLQNPTIGSGAGAVIGTLGNPTTTAGYPVPTATGGTSTVVGVGGIVGGLGGFTGNPTAVGGSHDTTLPFNTPNSPSDLYIPEYPH